jgi:hypothetical protein
MELMMILTLHLRTNILNYQFSITHYKLQCMSGARNAKKDSI